MVLTMEKAGLDIECHHHEVATGGQSEIDQRFNSMLKSADGMMIYKYIIRNVAYQYRQDRDLHAQANFSGQRLRHAYSPKFVERGQAALRG